MELHELPTPCYVVDEAVLIKNLETLSGVIKRTGCRILLAQKAFSMFYFYPLIGKYLNGTAASGLFEARLGHDEMGKENHVFSAAYREEEFDEIASICDHIVFNSFSQLQQYRARATEKGASIGIRINPALSTQDGGIYDPCAPGSRLGVTKESFLSDLLSGVEGIHFHCLCEQNSDALKLTLDAVEEKFSDCLKHMKWINFGGGHHITRQDYNLPLLESCINGIQDRYGVQIYLEPGEAVALNAGQLITTVLDVVTNDIEIAIVDASAACHMPDVLEMPYRPPLNGSGLPKEKRYTYRLAGPTCLAGDVIGGYSFDRPLERGSRLVFGDMAIYTMVKNNTFNGMPLPAIAVKNSDGAYHVVRKFGYVDFKSRLS